MDELDRLKDTFINEAPTYRLSSFYNALHIFSDAAAQWLRVGGQR